MSIAIESEPGIRVDAATTATTAPPPAPGAFVGGSRAVLLWYAAVYVALTIVYAWPVVRSFGSALPHDTGDPALNAWILWWNSQAVPLTTQWWNAPIFYPVAGSFALSETLLSLAPLTTPLHWLGANAVVTYNIAFLLAFPTAALAAHALAYRLTGRHAAALVAGVAFGFAPGRAPQAPHLQMLWSCWMPLCLLALHAYVERGRTRSLVAAAICWTLNGLTSGYFLVYFAVLAAVWVIWFVRRWRQAFAIGLAFALACVVLAPVLIGYTRHQSALGLARDSSEIDEFSADLSAYWATAPEVWFPGHWTLKPRPEGELYPGVALLLLIAAGGTAAWRGSHRGGSRWLAPSIGLAATIGAVGSFAGIRTSSWRFHLLGVQISVAHLPQVTVILWIAFAMLVVWDPYLRTRWRARSASFFYIGAALVMVAFSLGPTARLLGTTLLVHAPYWWLMQLPGGHALRVPARFGILVSLCLAIAGALACARLLRSRRSAIASAAAVAVLLDGWVFGMLAVPVPVLASISPGIDPGTPVLELPMRDVYTETAAMLRATVHRHPLVNGFSGYSPPHYGPLQEGLLSGDRSVFSALQQYGPLIVQVNRAADPGGTHAAFVAGIPGAEQLFRSPVGPVFRLPRARAVAAPDQSTALRIRSVQASTNAALTPALLDGRLDTYWHSGGPQTPGQQVSISFGEPVRLSYLELDLGAAAMDYPRELRVWADDDPAHPVTAWSGGTAGPAVLGTLRDRVRDPIVLALGPTPPASHFTLTLTDGDGVNGWSIAEIKAFGARAQP